MGGIVPTNHPGGAQECETAHPNGRSPLGLLKDHVELVSLELEYEKQEGWRRLLSLGAGVLLLFSSFAYLQAALIFWFLRAGLRWEGIGLLLGCAYLVLGMSVIWFFGRRRKGLGAPFQGSLAELRRSLRWIEKRFF